MAIGDVVNGMSPISTILDFQPAAGVECMISDVSDSVNGHSLYDGVTLGTSRKYLNGVQMSGAMKMFINHTNYLRLIASAGNHNWFTGIQIK